MAGARRTSRLLAAALLLVLGTGCYGEDPKGQVEAESLSVASGTPTASTASAAPEPAVTSDGVVVAAAPRTGPLTLYRLAPGSRTATPLRELGGPGAGAGVVDVSLSAGAEPTVCATWELDRVANEDSGDFVSRLLCYAPGRRSGAEVAVSGGQPFSVAVRPDGEALAWSTYAPEGNGRIDAGRLDGAAVSDVRGFLHSPSRPEGPDTFTGAHVDSLGWLGDDELAIGQSNQSDDGSGLRRFSLAPGQKGGWGDADVVEPPASEKGYTAYDSVLGAAEDGNVLAVQRGYAFDESSPPGRAVRIDVATGRVLEVVAFPRKGRAVLSVSGSSRAALYVTGARGGDDTVVSVRYAGESRGAPVSGLPSDVEVVVAQP